MSVLSRRQALSLSLDPALIAAVETVDELGLEVFWGGEILKAEQFRFEQAEEVLHHSIVQAAASPAHALPDAFVFQHLLVS